MKQKNLKTGIASGLFLLLALGLFAPVQSKAESPYGVSFQVFYDELMPYGDWVKDANYGYIWLPAVGADFHPYGTNGHWRMTEYGNTWVSYYDWGWAPFHYGRWYFDDFYQSWAWIPDYNWGPAWVNWRTGGGYYGWAPLGPGVSISVRVNIPSFHWVFLPSHRIYHHHAYNYYVPRRTRVNIYNNTTIINNTVVYNNNRYVSGPNRREIERVTRQTVPVYSLRGSQAPGRASVSRNSVELYRPDLSASRGRTVEARPSRVASAEQVKSSRAQSRNTYSDSPSRNTRSATSPATRSASPAERQSTRTQSATPSRSNTGTREASPSQRSGSFESRPYEQGRTRTASPTTRTQSPKAQAPSSRTQTSPARPSSGRESSGRVSQPSTRTQQSKPQTNGSRTQPSPAVRKSPEKSSSGRVSQPTQTRSTSPTVRSSGSNQNNRSTPKTTSTRTSTSKKSSTASSTQRSSSRTRGNN